MSKFTEKLQKETGGRFEDIKLSAVTVYVRKKTIELTLLYPDTVLALSDDDRAELERAAIAALNSDATVIVRFVKSCFDSEFAAKEVVEFFRAYPLISSGISIADIEADESGTQKSVRVRLSSAAYRYCTERNILTELQALFDRRYCAPVLCGLIEKDESESVEEETIPAPSLAPVPEFAGGRLITPENVDAFIGKPIYEKATYISDALFPRQSLTVCGTLTRFSDFTFTKKDGKEGTGWRLTLEDNTGAMECVHFPSERNKEKFALLKQGKEFVVRGSLAPGKKEGTMSYKLDDISFCTLPRDFVQNRLVRPVDTHYRTVFPQVYRESMQVSLFDSADADKAIPSLLKNNTVVVFDLETTGTNPMTDKIIEIGAVKIENGRFIETFSSLVDPKMPIPEGASKVNGITDDMVAGKPFIEDVLPDFYKFCDSAALAAHNIQFDASFAAAAGKPLGIYFDHEKYDTLQLSRKYFPGLRAYNLGALCEQFSIELTDAHRAVADALATAKLLIRVLGQMEQA